MSAAEALLRIQTLLEQHQQTMTAEPEVHWEGQSYSPVQGRPWLQMQGISRVRRPTSLTARTNHLWRGMVQVVVKHPAGDNGGLRPAFARAGAVAAHWPRGLVLGTPPFEVVIEETNLPPAYTTAGWISQPVTIAWYMQELPT